MHLSLIIRNILNYYYILLTNLKYYSIISTFKIQAGNVKKEVNIVNCSICVSKTLSAEFSVMLV